jgi:predicted Rossmann fold nucleotide-binding protein DprA/Smf involved in DNA uptake
MADVLKPRLHAMSLVLVGKGDAHYPERLKFRLAEEAPGRVTALGNFDLLGLPNTALFCSSRCQGDVILAAHDQAAQWRDEGRCIVSGFHSPVERDCFEILLRGRQPIIMCPGRAIDRMRIPGELKRAMANGRLLLLSPFGWPDRRVTKELAVQRNRFVAALADEIVFAYIEPGGHLDDLRRLVATWGIPHRHLGGDDASSTGAMVRNF